MNFKDVSKLVINLEQRKDRRKNISNVLKKYDYEFVNAIKTKLGCNLSHQKCIKIAMERKYKYVCIIEDDFIFLEQKKKLKIDEIKIPKDFDMFFIGGEIPYYEWMKIIGELVIKEFSVDKEKVSVMLKMKI